MNLAWTEDRIEILTKLWADGLSASQIAARLGGTTRNAVIGKVHRLHLEPRKDASRGGRMKGGAYTTPSLHKVQLPRVQFDQPSVSFPTSGNAALKPVFVPIEQPPVVALSIVQSVVQELNLPSALRVELLDLHDSMCRWPIGDPREDSFHFCGREKKAKISYCAHHARSAFRPKPQVVR